MKKYIQMKIDQKKEPVGRHDWQPADRTLVCFQPPLPVYPTPAPLQPPLPVDPTPLPFQPSLPVDRTPFPYQTPVPQNFTHAPFQPPLPQSYTPVAFQPPLPGNYTSYSMQPPLPQNFTQVPFQPPLSQNITPVAMQPPLHVDRKPFSMPPPLPPGSPPMLMSPKIETIKTEDEDSLSDSELPDVSEIKTESIEIKAESIETSTSESLDNQDSKNDADDDDKPICKDYLRNNCFRTNCIFRHEFDVSKIIRLYEFCKDYQNLGCNRPNCRFAHASVFEQERFYKTYVLPPHALAHQIKRHGSNQSGNNARGQVDRPPLPLSAPPHRHTPDFFCPPPPITGVEQLNNLSKIINKFKTDAKNLKRHWTDCSHVNASLICEDGNAQRVTKCVDCPESENSLLCLEVKYVIMLMETAEKVHKIGEIKKKQSIVDSILLKLSKNASGSVYGAPR